MNKEQVLNTPAMPARGPSYARGPYRFINREYLIVMYQSDPEAIRAALPEPLEPIAEPEVYYEFIKMPDSDRNFGDYTESGIVIPCLFEGKRCNFTCQMYLDDHPPIAGGREIWGFPKKYAKPSLQVSRFARLFEATTTLARKHRHETKRFICHCHRFPAGHRFGYSQSFGKRRLQCSH